MTLSVVCRPSLSFAFELRLWSGPLLSVHVHSPTEGVIGVKLGHFAHTERHPQIPLFPDDPPIIDCSLRQDETGYHIQTGALSAHITENPYAISFHSPTRLLTFSGAKHQALIDVPSRWAMNSASNSSCLTLDPASNPKREPLPDIVRYLHSELNISPGELIYGFGEQFGAFIKNGEFICHLPASRVAYPPSLSSGQSISIWNQDGGTSSDQAYKCVPFYITNRNYGVFINNPGEVEVEVGSEKVSRVGMSLAGNSLEYFIIYGDTPLDVSLCFGSRPMRVC